ncbi:MAG: OmpP1/FadL family transporter, partial [Mailhella sp.]
MNVSRNGLRGLSSAVLSQVKCAASALLVCGLMATSVSSAYAEGFGITEWSARGMALGGGAGGGMVARANDASAIAYNPAGITQIPGTTTQMGMAVSMLNFDISRTDTGKTISTSDQAWPIPHFYLTHQLNDKLWLGVGTFTRYGLGSQFPDNWGKVAGGNSSILKSVTLISTTLNPNIAYKINDILSVSAGVSYTWGYLSL